VVAVIGVIAATVTLTLQVVVVEPMTTKLWNKAQASQTPQQQFFEQGVSTTLMGSVTDSVSVADYFDSNANGIFGLDSNNIPQDYVGRFALFYTERLKMLNQQNNIWQIQNFHDQLLQLMNGNGPGTFQLNDPCLADSNPNDVGYNPYCDPCCQPYYGNQDPYFNASTTNHSSGYKLLRPSTCNPPASTCSAVDPYSASCAPPAPECVTNNPYGASYPYLYDPAFQNYANGVSFLAQFGRDQQIAQPTGTPPPPFTLSPNVMTPSLEFPNGIYPFFWLMTNYSPEVDNINPTTTPLTATSPQLHWCSPSGTLIPAAVAAPAGFPDLTQLQLSYACQGQDCCVNYLPSSLVGNIPSSISTTNGPIDIVGSGTNPAQDPSFGSTPTPPNNQWIPGDNQFCSAVYPYNNSSTSAPDGTCSSNTAMTSTSSSPLSAGSTWDKLDTTMHTLSDFVNFSYGFLSQDVGILNSTFATWYPQVAEWIAPDCGAGGAASCNDSSCDDGSTCTNGACADGDTCGMSGQGDGRLLSIYNPYSGFDLLGQWTKVITTWLNTTYMTSSSSMSSPAPWCVPAQSDASLNFNNGSNSVPTAENNYIAANGGSGAWGDLGHVIACLNYNATVPATSYSLCQTWLSNPACTSSPTGTPCDPATLGRSLYTGAPSKAPAFICGASSAYADWLQTSLTLASDEAPKFSLRAAFLKDVYTRGQTMQTMFQQADAALAGQTVNGVFQPGFLTPCAGTNCAQGGPAAQLMWAMDNKQQATSLPNSVIYGWTDKNLSNGQPGYAHIVKVTAFSPGRCGSPDNGTGGICGNPAPTSINIDPKLPWVKTTLTCPWWQNLLNVASTAICIGPCVPGPICYRNYELRDRDGYVYVKTQRWDQSHGALTFPNKLPLWQMSFHNPTSSRADTTGGLPSKCIGLHSTSTNGISNMGFGLTPGTVTALQSLNIIPTIWPPDATALGNAFMLNDEGVGPNAGSVDPNAKKNTNYQDCLVAANQLLASGIESHACASYVATDTPGVRVSAQAPPSYINAALAWVASLPTGNPTLGNTTDGTANYKIFFEPCPSSTMPEDLTGTDSSQQGASS
jgi:hypothetical protein